MAGIVERALEFVNGPGNGRLGRRLGRRACGHQQWCQAKQDRQTHWFRSYLWSRE
jgi:hypothetical protein